MIALAALPASPAAAQAQPRPELPAEALPGSLHYVALGDSYSSGEGAPYVPKRGEWQRASVDSDGWLGATGGKRCHRSLNAYPVRVWGELDRQDPGWGISFRACSGAKTSAMSREFNKEPGQFDTF